MALEKRGLELTAEVEGSEFAPYLVTINLHEKCSNSTRRRDFVPNSSTARFMAQLRINRVH